MAYLLRQTLGWLDEQGNPRHQEIQVSFRDLIETAGVSRGAIGPAINEAVSLGFIECKSEAIKKSPNSSGQSAVYSLRWDARDSYVRTPDEFVGFYAGEGNRTPVPNRFFDSVVPNESLSIVKVVGTVIRQTVGYQNQFGGRRSSHPLSYSNLQRLTKLSDRSTLSQALQTAQETGYIVCVERGGWIRRAVKAETSVRIADLIRRQKPDDDTPHVQILEAVAKDKNLPPVLVLTTER